MMKEIGQVLIAALHRFQSKKFLVWMVASVALFTRFIDADSWMIISGGYLGVQSFLDWKGQPGTTTSVKTTRKTGDIDVHQVVVDAPIIEEPTEEDPLTPPTPETMNVTTPIRRQVVISKPRDKELSGLSSRGE